MAEYTLAHIGINTDNAGEAMKAAKLFEVLFGLTVKGGNRSIFAGGIVEAMKSPYKGAHDTLQSALRIWPPHRRNWGKKDSPLIPTPLNTRRAAY